MAYQAGRPKNLRIGQQNKKNMKQTAVEWLEQQLILKAIYVGEDIYTQAKQMEKEQISKAWDDGDHAYFYSKKTGKDFENGDEYFNEIYKQQNKKT